MTFIYQPGGNKVTFMAIENHSDDLIFADIGDEFFNQGLDWRSPVGPPIPPRQQPEKGPSTPRQSPAEGYQKLHICRDSEQHSSVTSLCIRSEPSRSAGLDGGIPLGEKRQFVHGGFLQEGGNVAIILQIISQTSLMTGSQRVVPVRESEDRSQPAVHADLPPEQEQSQDLP